MNKTKRVKLSVLIIGIISSLLLVSVSKTVQIAVPGKSTLPLIAVKTQKKQADNNKAVFQKKIDALNRLGHTLSLQLTGTKAALEKAKKKNELLQVQVFSLANKRQDTATESVSNECRTLKSKVVELILSGNKKDSLYDDVVINIEQQLKNKDTIIVIQEEKYQSLIASFQTSLVQQERLTDQNNQYRKQLKRQQRKQKLAAVGILIIAALTTHSLIRN